MQDFSSSDAAQAQSQKPRKSPWNAVFRGLISLLIIAYLGFKVNWRELVGQLVRANFGWLALALFLFTVTYLLAAIRWWFLMQVQGIRLPMKVAMALTFIGQFFNSFLLGAVGGDIVKIFYLQKYAPRQKTHATLSIIIDRAMELFILLCASLLVMPWQLQWLLHSGNANSIFLGLLALFGLGLIAVVALALTPFHRAPHGVRRVWNRIPHSRIIELAVSGFRQHGSALTLTLSGLAVGTVLTLALVAAGSCIAIGIGLEVSYMQMLIILTVVICVISLPISIGGHGVREGIFVLMFAAFGVINIDRQTGSGQESAVLFSLLFFAIPLVLSLVGGIVYLTFRHDYGTLVLKPKAD
jgi:uncharacterized protein (TIRG00374 family)